MKKYEILPHPAELRLRIYGKTIEELFQNAALALAETLNSKFKSQKSKLQFKTQKLRIESTDINSLLVDFLSEILAKSQINKKVYKADFVKIRPESAEGLHYLEAELIGFPIERFDEDIKAVTYQDVNIKLKTKNLKLKTKVWQTDLVFDI